MINFLSRKLVLIFVFMIFAIKAQAFGPQLTYHGRIIDTTTNQPVSGTVQFLVQVVHPTIPSCVLYQETQMQNLSAADGNFTLTINGGSSTLPAPLLSPFADIFLTDSSKVINCITGGTAPGTQESRVLNVFFTNGVDPYEPLPSQTINYVPTAIEALNANTVGGFMARNLLRVVEINGFGQEIPYAVPAITRPLYEELDATIKGQSNYYVTSQGTVAYFSVPLSGEVTGGQSATVVSRLFNRPLNPGGGTYVGGEVMYFDGTSWIAKPGIAGTVQTVNSTNPYLTVSGGPPSMDPTIHPLLTLHVGTTANTVAAGDDSRIVNAFSAFTPLAGDVTGLVSATVVATVGGRTAAQISQSVSDTLQATAANTANMIVKRDGSGNVAVNTLSSTNTSTRNLLLYNSGNTNYAGLAVSAGLALDYVLTLPTTAPVSGFVLATDAGGNTAWISPTTGSVTNVSATAPLSSTGGFTPTISITRASTTVDGYLAASDFTTFNNKVTSVTVTSPLTMAGTSSTPQIGLQDSGVTAGTYTKFTVDIKGLITSATTLLASDIPDLDTSKITTGVFPIARGGTGAGALTGNGFVAVNASGSALTSTVCAADEVPMFNGTTWTCRLASANNSSATIVMRDANGDFTANNITIVQDMTVQRNLRVQDGMVGGYIGLTTPVGVANYDIVLPNNGVPVPGRVLAIGAGATSSVVTTQWITALTDVLASGAIIVGNASGTATPVMMSGDATLDNTGVLTLVDVGAGVTSGTEYAKVTVDGKGRVTSGAQLTNADINTALGYVPVSSVSATTPITLTGGASNPVIGLADSGVVSGAYGSNTLIPNFVIDQWGRITSATQVTYADTTNISKGIVQIGANITLSAGTISITSANVVAAMGSVSGDVTGPLNNTVVATVGGKTASEIATSVNDTQAATHLNSSSTIVRRDNNGNFTANNITTVQDMTVQRNLRVQDGQFGGFIGITTPIGVSSYDIVLPDNAVAPNVGQVISVAPGSTSSTVLTRWINALTDSLAPGNIFVGNASGTATGVTMTGDATMSDNGNLQLISVGAGVASGAQYTKVTVDGKGRVTSGTQLNNADVVAGLGYEPMNSVSTTIPLALTGGASNPVISLNNSGVVSGLYGSNTLIPNFTVDQWGRITSATATVYADTTASSKGIVQIGDNLTVSGGVVSLTSANVVSAMGSLSGDVSGNLNATVVNTVGGRTAANIATTVDAVTSATHLNSSGTIVRRDANGDFTANNITTVQNMTVQANLRLQNGTTNYVGFAAPIASPNYDIILPNNTVAPSVGQVLAVASGSAGALVATNWINALTDILAPGNILVGNASGTATSVAMTGDATMSNTGNLQLISVGAGVASGAQYTKVTVDGKGRVTSGAQLNNADVVAGLGYEPMSSVSATTPLAITGGASNPVISLNTSGVTSGAYGSNTLIPNFIVDAWGRITSATATVYADATTATKGILQVGSNLTVSGGVISLNTANVVSAMGSLGGDVSGTLDATVVQTVGGRTAANIATTVDAVTSATHLNSSGTIVRRDNNGNFTANNITTVQDMTVQRNLRLQNGTTNYIGLAAPIASPDYDIVLPNNSVAPSVGQVLAVATGSTSAVIATNWINALTDSLASGFIFVGNASGTAAGVAMTGDATMSNTGNLQLISVGSGVTSGTQYTKVTVDGKGRVTSGTQLNNADVVAALGYTPADDAVSGTYLRRANDLSDLASSATARNNLGLGTFATASFLDLGSASATGIIADARLQDFAGVASGTQYTKLTVDGKGRVTSGAQLNNADVIAGLGYAPMNSVSTTAPITLSGGASNPVIGLANSGVTSGTYPKVTVDDWGRVTSGTNLNFADVTTGLGYSPVASVTVTAPIVLTGTASMPSLGLANSGVTAGTYGSDTLIPNFIVDAWGRITSATTTVYADATTAAKGIVQIGSNITVSGGVISLTGGNVVSALGYTPFNEATPLAGDVTGTLSATVVSTVGGKTAAQVSQSVSDTITATHLNSSGTIVRRDANGDFTARNITTVQNMTVQANLRLQNGTSNYVGFAAPIASPDYDIVLPNNSVAPSVGQVLSVASGSTATVIATRWVNALTDVLAPGNIFVGNASGTATGVAMSGDATMSDSGNLQLISVGGGVTSGTQYTKVTVDGKGRVTSGAQLNNADVVAALGYTPADDAVSGTYLRRANDLSDLASSATARNNLGLGTFATANSLDLGSASATGIIADARLQDFTNVTSGTQYTKVTVDGKGRVTSGAQLSNADVNTALGYVPVNSVSSTSPIAITGGASNPVIGLENSGVTAATYPKVTVDIWGRVTSGTDLNFSDVTTGLGYTPVALVSATAPIILTGSASMPTIGLANSGVTAGSYGSDTLIPNFIVDAWGRITSATATAYADATAAAKGIVQIGSNITVSGGVISLTGGNVVSALGYTPFNEATSLAGDVTGTLSATVVSTVGGKTSAQVSQSVSDTIAATHLNSSGTIVRRDANGDFTARNITTVQNMTVQANLRLQNGTSNYVGFAAPIASPDYDIVLPNNSVAPTVGQVLSVASGSTGTVIATRWVNALTDVLAPGNIFVGSASGTAAGVAMSGDATISSNGDLQLISVGSGVTSGTQYTKVTVDGKGRVTSGAQLNNADVVAALGYTPADDAASGTYLVKASNLSDLTSSATARANLGLGTFATANTVDLGSASATGIIADARLQDFSGIVSGTQYTRVTVDGKGRVTSGAQLSNADVNAALGYTPMASVSSTSPITLTGGASNPVIGLANSGVAAGSYAKVTVDLFGRVTSGTGLSIADIIAGLGYTPVALVSATAPIMLTGTASEPVFSLANSGVIAGTYGTNTGIPYITVDAWGRITSAGTQAYADATAGAKGIVQIGSNITVTAGTISVTSANVIAAMGALSGDVSGTLDNAVVQTVGGRTAANIATTVDAVASATHLNSSGTIVRRDANGDFTARNITTVQNMTVQANLRVQNGTGNYIGITTPIATPNYDIILPNNAVAPNVGQVLAVASGSTGTLIATTWVNALTDYLADGQIYMGNGSNQATGVTVAGDATIANTGVLTLASVGAGVTSGSQYTKVTVDGKGRVVTGAQLNNSDVVTGLGYTPAGAVSVTAPITLTGTVSAPVIGMENSGVTAGTYNKVTVDAFGRVTSSSALNASDITTALTYTPVNRAGDTMTGGLTATSLAASTISASGSLAVGAASVAPGSIVDISSTSAGFLMPRMTTVQRDAIATGAALDGLQIFNITTRAFEYYDAGAVTWRQVVTNNTALTSLNGSTSSTQSFVTGSAGTSFNVTTAAGVHTFNIPMAATVGVTQGALSNTQYQALVDKVGSVSGVAGEIVVTGTVSAPVIGLANSGVTAATYGSSATIPLITVDAFGRVTSVTASALRPASAVDTGVVSIGNNITVNGAGQISLTSANVLNAFGAGLSGDVTGSLSATVVATVGGKTAAEVATTVDTVASATSLNSSSTIVRRDAFGNFVANSITTVQDMTVQRYLRVQNGTTGNSVGLFAPLTSANYDIYLPSNGAVPPAGYGLGISAATSSVVETMWMPMMSGNIASGTFYVGNASGAATAVLMTGDATLSNTGNLQLVGVGAGVTSGTQYTKVTVDGKGRVVAGAQLSSTDVTTALAYTPLASITATAPITITGGASNPVVGLANSGVIAATYAKVTVDAFGRVTSGSALAASDLPNLAGDVTGSIDANTVATVGGKTSAQISQSVSDTLTATAANTASMLVKRDGSGGFAAGAITMSGVLTAPANGLVLGTNQLVANNGGVGIGTAAVTAGALLDISGTDKGVLFPRMTTVQRGSVPTVTGMQIFNTDTNAIEYYDGTQWRTVVTNLSAITSLNGSTAAVQTFTTGSAGTSFNIVTAAGNHTFNIPMAATAGVTQGALSNTQYQTFVDKVGSVSGVAGEIVVTGTVSAPVIGLANSGVAAATYGTSATVPVITVDAFGRLTTVTTQNLRIADATNTGVVSIGNNITVNGAGQISLTSANVLNAFGTGLSGDVTGSLSATVVAAVGGKTSAQISQSVSDTLTATNLNTANMIMKRDATGAVSAGAISQSQAVLRGSTAGTLTLQTPATVTSYALTFPASQGAVNQVLSNDGAGLLSWINVLPTNLANGAMFIGNGSGVASAVIMSGDATIANTGALTLASVVTAGSVGTASAVPTINFDAKGRITSVSSQAYQDATATLKGILNVPAAGNLTVAGGAISLTGAGVVSALGTQSAATFFAGPTTGGAANPSFRAIASTDLPTTGVSGVWVNGGNAFGTATSIGTNDNNSLVIKTNNVTRATIDTSGVMTASVSRAAFTGQAYAAVNVLTVAANAATADANLGNVMRMTTATTAAHTVSVTNVQPGAAYTLSVIGTGANVGQINITCNGAPASYIPANGARVSGGTYNKSIYTFVFDGEHCLVTWITGF